MNRPGVLLVGIVATLCATPLHASDTSTWSREIHAQILEIDHAFEGELALYIENLESGASYEYNASTPMYLASTVKLLVLAELFRLREANLLRFDERIKLGSDDIRDGARLVGAARAARTLTIDQLTQAMMQHSDNIATDVLITRIGLAELNAANQRLHPDVGTISLMLDVRRHVWAFLSTRARELTADQVYHIRKERGIAARAAALSRALRPNEPWSAAALHGAYERYYASTLNSAPMRILGKLIAQMGRGELVSTSASQAMLDIMRNCKTGRRRIAAGLPEHTDWAHKTGTQYQRACDMGLVRMSPSSNWVIAVCAKNHRSLSDAETAMARVGAVLWRIASHREPVDRRREHRQH